MRGVLFVVLALGAAGSTACPRRSEGTAGIPVQQLPGHAGVGEDHGAKDEPRLVPAEAYMRTYLQLFGGLAPLEVQKKAKGSDGNQLFDTWDDYLAALGFPDYRNDIPRGVQTNALMVATFERLGVALCDRAVEHDLGAKGKPGALPTDRLLFSFEPPAGAMDATKFTAPFDLLHRTFLGYPASLAPTDRSARFLALYQDTVKRHADPAAPKSRFTPEQAEWATVCYGLVRHPEFQLY
ncbi:MAG: hypothetical protein ABI175_02165 [Polyangiales bacterium]